MSKLTMLRGLFAALALVSAQAFGQASASGHITQLWTDATGSHMWVTLDTPTVNPANCGTAGSTGYYAVEFAAGSNRGPMVAFLLVAQTQHQVISMWIVGCSATAYQGTTRPLATDVYLPTAP